MLFFIFRFSLELGRSYIDGFASSQESQNYTVARDTFLAHLGATLWGSMRHIVSPSVADGVFHYYEKISFQLFFITQEVTYKLGDMKILAIVKYLCFPFN